MDVLVAAKEALLPLGAAFLLALSLGWERERRLHQAPGLRTFPLVALGACTYLLLGRHIFAADPDAQARVLQGLITGIGFIGGGAILKSPRSVRGIATAASLWNTGALGATAAYERYDLGLLLALANLLTLHYLVRFHSSKTAEDERSD